jgi:hypothetical protein
LQEEARGTHPAPEICYPDGMVREEFAAENWFPAEWSLSRRIEQSMAACPTPGGIDPVAVRDLRRLLRLMREDGVWVVMVAMPMHAAAREIWRRNGVADDEQAALNVLATTAREYGARYVDFSSPAAFGGRPDDFLDGYHATRRASRRMVDALFPRGRAARW